MFTEHIEHMLNIYVNPKHISHLYTYLANVDSEDEKCNRINELINNLFVDVANQTRPIDPSR